jgi:hypothetical protein
MAAVQPELWLRALITNNNNNNNGMSLLYFKYIQVYIIQLLISFPDSEMSHTRNLSVTARFCFYALPVRFHIDVAYLFVLELYSD